MSYGLETLQTHFEGDFLIKPYWVNKLSDPREKVAAGGIGLTVTPQFTESFLSFTSPDGSASNRVVLLGVHCAWMRAPSIVLTHDHGDRQAVCGLVRADTGDWLQVKGPDQMRLIQRRGVTPGIENKLEKMKRKFLFGGADFGGATERDMQLYWDDVAETLVQISNMTPSLMSLFQPQEGSKPPLV